MRRRRSALVLTFALAASGAAGCEAIRPKPLGGEGPTDGGAPASPDADAASGPMQRGRIVDAVGKTGIAGALVSVGGGSVSTASDGTYAVSIPKNAPYSMSVTAPDYFRLAEQEWIVKTDVFDRGDTALLSAATARLLSSLLPARDPQKGLLAVRIYPLPPCDSEQGSTLTLEPAGVAQLTYFAGGVPNKTATSTTKDESFSGIFTNVEPGVLVKVTVASPLCEQVPFPVDFDGATLTGVHKAEAGDVIAYLRVFIGPKKPADAGAD